LKQNDNWYTYFNSVFVGFYSYCRLVWESLHNIDVREHGSGNAGATNTLRVLGNKAGFIVLFIDMLKGFIATNLAYLTEYSKEKVHFLKYKWYWAL
jgi:glycerol-3-phosphate acyltransferase PlsY